MSVYLLLPIIVLLSALATYVLTQNPGAAPNRLYALLTLNSIVLMAAGLIRLTGADTALATAIGAMVIPQIALNNLLLAWLILALCLPERFRAGLSFWLIGLPYLAAVALSVVDAIFGLGLLYGGLGRDNGLTFGPLQLPALMAYFAGQLALMGLCVGVAIRRPATRAPALVILAGLLLGQVMSQVGVMNNFFLITYISTLPIDLAFAWLTLRYGVFRPSSAALQAAIEILPDGVILTDGAGQIRYANRSAADTLGLAGAGDGPPLEAALSGAGLERAEVSSASARPRLVRRQGQPLTLERTEVTLPDRREGGRVVLLRDITRDEEQAAALAEQNAEQRRLLDLVASLETPVSTLADGVIFAPLVGHLDSRRSQALSARLLQAVADQRARAAILDVAGVPVVDTGVAGALVRLAQGLRLLGCAVVLSGIGPQVAVTLIQLGVTLDGVRTARSPQEALALAVDEAGRG